MICFGLFIIGPYIKTDETNKPRELKNYLLIRGSFTSQFAQIHFVILWKWRTVLRWKQPIKNQ